jgi:iron(III) transport system substrate-binding protein
MAVLEALAGLSDDGDLGAVRVERRGACSEGHPVVKRRISRRTALKGVGAAVAALPVAARVLAQAPPAEAVTPALIAAARKEGRVNFYTAMEISVAELYAKAFEAAFPGIAVSVERSGAERIFARIGQEYASRIYNVDLVNTTDAAHALAWKREGWLAPYLPEDAVRHFAPGHVDPDGTFATIRILFCAVAYNTQLVKAEDAPRGFLDLLDPKWAGKLVKAHPGYSGLILTATHAMARELGWRYFEKLAKQRVMQVQSGVDPPKKVALGERAAMVDGADYIAFQQKDKGAPIEVVYPVEGAPLINSPNAIFKAAPNPNAARLFQSWMCSGPGQQALVDVSGQYVPHALAKAKAGRRPLQDIKAMKDDPAAILTQADEIKARYTAIFKV